MSTLSAEFSASSDVMVVDDNPANLTLLEGMLLNRGHEVRSFPLGRLALAAAAKQPPDLILLDINMPEMNGYEVCGQLKAAVDLRDIPVIFLSALHETQDKVKAFRAGGVDYISKPFRLEEVHARVEAHLQLYRLQRALKHHNERLEQTVAARTLELAAANARLTILDHSKSDFLRLISHEFRTPLNGVLGVSSLILDNMQASEMKTKLEGIYGRARRRILALLDDALLLNTIEASSERFGAVSFPLNAVVRSALDRAREFGQSREVTLLGPTSDTGTAVGNEALLTRALQALLETAVKFSQKGETVRVSVESEDTCQRVIIESRGRTIPDRSLPRFFEVLSIGEAIVPGGDLGVGPPLAQRIVSLFGGSVSVVNVEPAGIKLTILLNAGVPQDSQSRAAVLH